ncbi:type VI secretion system tube protein TssD [uncultured Cohaesibacter sp.]|uniref:type VI secretion system tube protein TssD n=1 Tax=uncultured Cohaesibacter sp. TaxID=1002546 RepID=UPI0029C81EF8|nr:type VI secretion system tube protein TssD [uncultured Cohaesibacter sp.]
MATVGYMKISEVSDGAGTSKSIRGLAQSGHEDEITVFSFQANAIVPRDPNSGTALGTRKHLPAVFTKPLDKASPILWQNLVTGQAMDIELKFFRINTEDGTTEHYYTMKWSDAILVDGKTIIPDTTDSANDLRGHYEEFSFTYRKIEWTHEIASSSASDDYRER